eukprot:4833534-Pyramimonas_sp.AAC.1
MKERMKSWNFLGYHMRTGALLVPFAMGSQSEPWPALALRSSQLCSTARTVRAGSRRRRVSRGRRRSMLGA